LSSEVAARNSGVASLVGGVHVGPGLEEQFQHGGIGTQRGVHQRGVAPVIAGVNVRAILQQRLHLKLLDRSIGFRRTVVFAALKLRRGLRMIVWINSTEASEVGIVFQPHELVAR
jgi:hypothetical protein